jgi:release factor glutamine methyltransferase
MPTAVAETWTIRRVVQWTAQDFAARGLDSPRLDAELLVAHALQIDRVRLYMDLDRPLVPDELAAIRALVIRRRKREPLAYVIGTREFFGRSFAVTPAVLVPRPETETLVERALELLPPDAEGPVLDVGTGSGCIALTLAAERRALQMDATDLAEAALAVAARNAERLGVAARVRFYCGDLFAALPEPRRYALVVSNPPYISLNERPALAPELAREPEEALFAGEDGLAIIRRLVAEAPSYLAPGGTLLVEIGAGQGEAVLALLRAAGFEDPVIHKDLGGRERVAEGRCGAS